MKRYIVSSKRPIRASIKMNSSQKRLLNRLIEDMFYEAIQFDQSPEMDDLLPKVVDHVEMCVQEDEDHRYDFALDFAQYNNPEFVDYVESVMYDVGPDLGVYFE